MAANSGVVGVLRALLTADTSQFDTSMRKSATTARTTTTAISGLGKELTKLTPQAERMVKALSGDRVIATANNLVAAVTKIGGAQKLTEANQARVNRTLTEAIAQYKAIGDTAPKAMLALEQATRKVVVPTDNLKNSTSSLDLSLSGVGKSILTWAAGFVTAQAAINIFKAAVHNTIEEIKTLTIQGAAVGDVTENFDRLTAGAKQSGAALLGELRAGTHATIDDLTLMKTVNQDLTAGLKLTQDQWKLVSKGAFALAQRDATSVTEALERMNQALLTGQARQLKPLIGPINADAAEKRYLASIHKTGEALTDEGKIEALRLEMLRRLGMAVDRLGEQTDGLDEKVAQAQASWTNFQNELGRTVATSPVILAGLDGIEEVLARMVGGNKDETIKNIGKAIDGLAVFFIEAAKVGIVAAGEIEKAWDGLKSTFADTAQDIDRIRGMFIALQGTGKILSSDTLADAKHNFAELVTELAKVGVSMVNRAKDMDTLGTHQRAIDANTEAYVAILNKTLVAMRSAQGAHNDLSAAAAKTGQSMKGLADDTDALTQLSPEAKAALKAYKDALESIHKTSTVLAPVQQETIRLLNEAGISADVIAKALHLSSDQVTAAIKAIELYGQQYGTLDQAISATTRSVEGLTAEQRAQIKVGLDAGLTVEEITKQLNRLFPALHLGTLAVKEFGDSLKEIDALRADVFGIDEKALSNFQAVIAAESAARSQLAQDDLARQQQVALALTGIAGRRAQFEISMATRAGASWKTIYALERHEAEITLHAVLAGINAETRARELEVQAIQDAIDAAKSAGIEVTPDQERNLARAKALLEAQRNIAQLQIQKTVEDFTLAEQDKLDELKHTHDIWVRTWDNMRAFALDATGAVADGFSTFLVGLGQQTFKTVNGVETLIRGRFHNAMIDVWRSIRDGIRRLLDDILSHFINVFLKGMIRAIAGAKLGQQLGNVIGGGMPGGGGGASGVTTGVAERVGGGFLSNLLGIGGGAAASSYVGAEVAGVASATTAAVSAGSVGAEVAATEAAAYGGGAGFSLTGLLTNPYTAVGVLAAYGGYKLYKHLTAGKRANDNRDKFLTQFKGFDTAHDKEDVSNPPGFHGLDRLLTKYKQHALFPPLIGARDPGSVKRAEMPIAAFMATLGRNVKMFNLGGFVPPGVVQPAILHGGAYGEDIRPRGPQGPLGGAGGWTIVNNWHVSTIDANGVREFVQSGEFTHHLGNAFEKNKNYLTTKLQKALG